MQANFQRAVLSAVLCVLVSACPGTGDSPTTYPMSPVTSPTWSSQDAGMRYTAPAVPDAAPAVPDAAPPSQEPPRPPTYPWYCFRSGYTDVHFELYLYLYLELHMQRDSTFSLCSRTLADCEQNRGKYIQLFKDKGEGRDDFDPRECRFQQKAECMFFRAPRSREDKVACTETEKECVELEIGLHDKGYSINRRCMSSE